MAGDRELPLQGAQARRRLLVHEAVLAVAAAAEVEAQHGVGGGPVPPVVDGEAPEQRFVALEQLLDGVHEEALAEAPRTRQEVVLALVHQPPNVGGLVHVVAAFLPDLAEGPDADGEPPPRRARVRTRFRLLHRSRPCAARRPCVRAPIMHLRTGYPGVRGASVALTCKRRPVDARRDRLFERPDGARQCLVTVIAEGREFREVRRRGDVAGTVPSPSSISIGQDGAACLLQRETESLQERRFM